MATPLDDLTATLAARAPDDLRARVQAILGRSPAATPAARRLPPASDRSVEARLARQEAAINRLVAAHEALGRRVEALQQSSNNRLSTLLTALQALNLRSRTVATRAAEAASATQITKVRLVRQQRHLRSALMNARIERVSSVVHSTQRAAFGQAGSVVATNNLLLAGNELFWTFVGPTLRGLGAISESSATVAALIAPVGALATGQLAVGGRQVERFVSGVATFTGDFVVRQSLKPLVARSLVSALERASDLVVQLTPLDPTFVLLSASVRDGILTIRSDVESPPTAGTRVAWMVDLGPIIG